MSDNEPIGGLIRAARRKRQQRRWTAEVFPTSVGGTLRAPYPSGVSPPVTGGEALFGSSPIGEILRATIANEHHGPGEPLTFQTILQQVGFPEFNAPGVEIELPHTAVYGIEGDFSYQPTVHEHGSEEETHPPFIGGGSVSLLLNGVGIPGLSPIHAGGPVERSLGKTFTLAEEFVAEKGDVLSIILDYENGEPTIAGVIEVATKEPLRVFAQVAPPELPIETTGQTFTINTDGQQSAAIAVEFEPEWQAGDLVAVLFNMASTEATLVELSTTPSGLVSLSHGWQFLGDPVIVDNPGVAGQGVAFVMWKILTAADISVIQVTRAIGTHVWQRTPSVQGRVVTINAICPYPGAGGIQLLDLQASAPASPWSTELSASGSGLLTAAVIANRFLNGSGGGGPGPSDVEVSVDEWDEWGFDANLASFGYKVRVQTAASPQLARTISITTGTPEPESLSCAAIWAVN